jgi:hypothetical protein
LLSLFGLEYAMDLVIAPVICSAETDPSRVLAG